MLKQDGVRGGGHVGAVDASAPKPDGRSMISSEQLLDKCVMAGAGHDVGAVDAILSKPD
jgi:hypothetical protein